MIALNDIIDSNLAGSNNFNTCVLHIYDTDLNIQDRNVTNTHGFLKVDPTYWANLHNMSFFELINSPNYISIVAMMDLRRRVDYSIENNYDSLRYGAIEINCINREATKNLLWLFQDMFPSFCSHVHVIDNAQQ